MNTKRERSINNVSVRPPLPPHVLHHKLKNEKDFYLMPSSGQSGDNTSIKDQSSDVDDVSSHESSNDVVISAVNMRTPESISQNIKLETTASEHTRQQIKALTGQTKSIHWEAETSIIQASIEKNTII